MSNDINQQGQRNDSTEQKKHERQNERRGMEVKGDKQLDGPNRPST